MYIRGPPSASLLFPVLEIALANWLLLAAKLDVNDDNDDESEDNDDDDDGGGGEEDVDVVEAVFSVNVLLFLSVPATIKRVICNKTTLAAKYLALGVELNRGHKHIKSGADPE